MTTTSIGSSAWREAAGRANELIAALDSALLTELAGPDPFGVIEGQFGVPVEIQDFAPTKQSSVVGAYFDDPPRIVVGKALSAGRMRFTSLHELGHHLIWTEHTDLALALLGPPRKEALEEAICDSFAGAVLIPREVVSEVIDEKGPDAQAVITLHSKTNASRAAAAVRAAEHLGASGHVMVTDLDGVVQFTATRGIPFVVAPGAVQHDGGIVMRASRSGHAKGTDHVTYKSGTISEEFFVEARREGNYVFAVFTKGEAPWESLHVLPDRRKATARSAVCRHCSLEFSYWQPHGVCGRPRCDYCGRCGCAPRPTIPEGQCVECFRTVRMDLIQDGVCKDCRGD